MMMEVRDAKTSLERVLAGFDELAVAVSGGVDSMVLAFYAHELLADKVTMYHAVSAAVTPEATARVQHYAAKFAWSLKLIDAHEFEDANYLSNPVNRCFFCKTNLYDTVAKHTNKIMASGANLDDLGDYRPGLSAADNYKVRHPLVEAGISKAMVRDLARAAELHDLAELPAAPCLSSRITTGIPVTMERVKLVYEVEKLLKQELGFLKVIRCRVQAQGVEIQLDPVTLTSLEKNKAGLEQRIKLLCERYGHEAFVSFAPYKMGSAFLKESVHV